MDDHHKRMWVMEQRARTRSISEFMELVRLADQTEMPRVLGRHMGPAFASGHLTFTGCRVKRVSYKPETEFRLLLQARVADSTGKELGDQVFFAKFFTKQNAGAIFDALDRTRLASPQFGPPVFFVPEWEMILWAFPNDPDLPGLSVLTAPQQPLKLINAETVAEVLRTYRSQLGVPRWADLDGVTTQVVKYVPADRCTLRHELDFGGFGRLTVYTKTFNVKTNGQAVYEIMRSLRAALLSNTGEFLIPEPLCCDAATNTIFVHGVQGAKAHHCLKTLDLQKVARQIGIALAGLHQCRLDGLSVRSDGHLSKMAEAQARLGNAAERWESRIASVTETLRGRLSHLTQVGERPIHGAFRLSQILLADGKLALVDFDEFRLGNPISDVGSFLAHLFYLPLTGRLTQEESFSAARCFCLAYAERAPWGLPRDMLAWMMAIHLISKEAKRCIKRPRSGYTAMIDQLLDLAVEILEGKLALI